ncbi:MAG: hypothetical protein KGL04_04190, partial [Elusimicrobia bacterium]|nr:hypothetical protein [Elusimicrobiota bacterium]
LSAGPISIHRSLFAAPPVAAAAAGLPAKYIVSVRRDHGPPGLAAQNPVLSPQGSRAPPASVVL